MLVDLPSAQSIVFCGGCYGRDWPLMMEIVKATPEVRFYMVMKGEMKKMYFGNMSDGDFPTNVKVLTDIPYQQFMKCLCQSKMVCMPIDCESPQGLIVMFEAAANNKMILTSDTPTTQEYFDDCQRMGKEVRQWREAIRYYLLHKEERRERAMWFHTFLKEECQETAFAETVKKLVMSFAV